jgi:uncharacterized OsmC-like protein
MNTPNTKLEAIANLAAGNLKQLISEAEDDINKAWAETAEEAQLQETKPKLRIGFTITLDIDADRMETALAWSTKRKLVATCPIPDPNQPELEV